MMNCREIDELAPLYLSGELEEPQRDHFREHLAQCRTCASQINRDVALDERLRQAVTAELPDVTAVERSVRGRMRAEHVRRLALMAAVAAVFVFAAILGYRALRPVGRVFADAALDHRLEVIEHQPRHWRSDPAEIEKLAARYELRDAGALAPAGYRLVHAKICGIDGKPALHAVFTNGNQEVSVYVRTRSAHGDAVRTVKIGSEQLASVHSDRFEAVIATDGSSGECLRFARSAKSALI